MFIYLFIYLLYIYIYIYIYISILYIDICNCIYICYHTINQYGKLFNVDETCVNMVNCVCCTALTNMDPEVAKM